MRGFGLDELPSSKSADVGSGDMGRVKRRRGQHQEEQELQECDEECKQLEAQLKAAKQKREAKHGDWLVATASTIQGKKEWDEYKARFRSNEIDWRLGKKMIAEQELGAWITLQLALQPPKLLPAPLWAGPPRLNLGEWWDKSAMAANHPEWGWREIPGPNACLKAVSFGFGPLERGTVIPMLQDNNYKVTVFQPDQKIVDRIRAEPAYQVTAIDLVGRLTSTRKVTHYKIVHAADSRHCVTQLAISDLITCRAEVFKTASIRAMFRRAARLREGQSERGPLEVLIYSHPYSGDITQEIVTGGLITVHMSYLDRFYSEDHSPTSLDVRVESHCQWHIPRDFRGLTHPHGLAVSQRTAASFHSWQVRHAFIRDIAKLAAAYLGFYEGIEYVHEALRRGSLAAQVQHFLQAPSTFVRRHEQRLDGQSEMPLDDYIQTVFHRLANPAMKMGYRSICSDTGSHLKNLLLWVAMTLASESLDFQPMMDLFELGTGFLPMCDDDASRGLFDLLLSRDHDEIRRRIGECMGSPGQAARSASTPEQARHINTRCRDSITLSCTKVANRMQQRNHAGATGGALQPVRLFPHQEALIVERVRERSIHQTLMAERERSRDQARKSSQKLADRVKRAQNLALSPSSGCSREQEPGQTASSSSTAPQRLARGGRGNHGALVSSKAPSDMSSDAPSAKRKQGMKNAAHQGADLALQGDTACSLRYGTATQSPGPRTRSRQLTERTAKTSQQGVVQASRQDVRAAAASAATSGQAKARQTRSQTVRTRSGSQLPGGAATSPRSAPAKRTKGAPTDTVI